jgi:ABC-type Fe3+-hydroxamate transport system substrate-binding protein
VGTIIQPSIETIALLRPDLVIASEEDNAVQHLDRLKALGIRTVSFPKTGILRPSARTISRSGGCSAWKERLRIK